MLDAAEAGGLVIITSALTIAEVLWLKGEQKLPASRAKQIEAFFRNRWIVIREVDRFVAEDARQLVWDKNVKPKDVLHLAKHDTSRNLGFSRVRPLLCGRA